MWSIKELEAEAVREIINLRERAAPLREERENFERNYSGGMSFKRRGDGEYLIKRSSRAKGRVDRSLGPRSPETEAILADFKDGRERSKARIKGLESEIEKRRRMIRARGVGRLPFDTAEIVREMDKVGWLGDRLRVVGTSALYAYEARAGVMIEAGELATDDIDILNDARREISIAGALSEGGLIGVLQKADPSFHLEAKGSFRARNNKGFLFDLIGPHAVHPMKATAERAAELGEAQRLSDLDTDFVQIGIDGLEWLVNAPRFDEWSFDSRGWPVWIPTIDPRAFAAHKLWVSQRPDRRPEKARRDVEQAVIAAVIAEAYLGLDFDDPALSAVPRELIDGVDAIRDRIDKEIATLH